MMDYRRYSNPAGLSGKNNRDELVRKSQELITIKQQGFSLPEKQPDYHKNKSDKLQEKNSNSVTKQKHLILLVILCGSIVSVLTIMLSIMIITQVSDILASRIENASLREIAESFEIFESDAESDIIRISAFDMEMRRINPDYICWIRIEGTTVDHPVVRTDNNEKYLNTSFTGEENQLGTLFMDYRCVGNYVPHIIIYGHNSRTGDMFGGLRNFLDEQYMTEHSIITLIVNDRIVEYEIFSARRTNIHDPAYFIDFSTPGSFRAFLERIGAPLDATQIITLSTCVGMGDDDERMIVQGALR